MSVEQPTKEEKVQTWLAVPAGHDTVRLIPIEGRGVDFFVKLNDYEDLRASLRRAESARKGLADENTRLRSQLRGKTFITGSDE